MAKTNEGVILTDPEGDEGFHAPILGADQLPPELLARLKAEAERNGLDPAIVRR